MGEREGEEEMCECKTSTKIVHLKMLKILIRKSFYLSSHTGWGHVCVDLLNKSTKKGDNCDFKFNK